MQKGVQWLAALVALWGSFGCKPQPAGPVPPPPQEVPIQPNLPVDFVVLVDDSASISPSEQAVVREAIMLLADLAEPGDRVCALAFGAGAHKIATQTLSSDNDRRTFKQAISSTLRFREKFSDIRAGLKLLADQDAEYYRPKGQSLRTAIVLSDGKLEPQNRDSKTALAELRDVLRKSLPKVQVFAVALGETTSRQPIPGLTDATGPKDGVALMEHEIARSADRFVHAKSLDQLLDLAFAIFAQTKGLTSLVEPGEPKLRVDSTAELLTLVVRKKTAEGTSLAKSADLRLKAPGREALLTAADASGLDAQGIYWSNDYEYFDLIQVRHPTEGMWRLSLVGGEKPQILSHIVSPIELRYSLRPTYFANEAAEATVWLFDRRRNVVSRQAGPPLYRLQTRIASHGASGEHVPLRYDEPSGQFALPIPNSLVPARPGKVQVDVVAQKRKPPGSETMDEWFVRRSPPITIEILEPFINWLSPPTHLATIPIPFVSSLVVVTEGWLSCLPRGIEPGAAFGAQMATPKPSRAPNFEVPPNVELEVAVFDPSKGSWRSHGRVLATSSNGTYAFPLVLRDLGEYRYRYHLTGTTPEGRVTIVSPWQSVEIHRNWCIFVAFWLLVLAVLQWISGRTARLQGNVTGAGGGRLERHVEERVVGGVRFTVTARRLFFLFRKRAILRVSKGALTIDGVRVSDDSGAFVLRPRATSHDLKIGENVVKLSVGDIR